MVKTLETNWQRILPISWLVYFCIIILLELTFIIYQADIEPSGSQNEASPEGEDQPTSLIVTNLHLNLFGNQQMKVFLVIQS